MKTSVLGFCGGVAAHVVPQATLLAKTVLIKAPPSELGVRFHPELCKSDCMGGIWGAQNLELFTVWELLISLPVLLQGLFLTLFNMWIFILTRLSPPNWRRIMKMKYTLICSTVYKF